MDQPPNIVVRPPGPESRRLGDVVAALECPAFEERRKKRAALDAGADAAGIVLARGEGSNLFDVDGNRFVDLAAGFGAAILGHGPSPAHEAVKAQTGELAQGLGDLYASDIKVRLLERLAGIYPEPKARVLFGQSGADALTAAIKTAALATSKPGLIAFEGAYHGLSYAPLAACGFRPSFREPFASQLNPHVAFVPYPRTLADVERSLDAIREALARGSFGTILVEPVLGRGGVVPAPPGFLRELGALAHASAAVVIADEIWTGCGRGGSVVRSLDEGLVPDIVCLGKGLGASFPISACIGSERVMQAWARGGEVLHTSTHAGAPIGCAAALAALEAIETQGLDRRAAKLGDTLMERLRSEVAGMRAVVRGAGLLVGIELASGAVGLAACRRLLERGYVTTVGGASAEVIVVTPPLTIAEDVLLGFAAVLRDVVREVDS
ncbi:MAG: aspartate aminotransferase family protein [Polyangiaceae bacterium]|nr:aspartate aminotransferase family protein [Polyangiaceae bacterium]